MRAVVIYALAAVALAQKPHGTLGEPKSAAGLDDGKLFKYFFRFRRSNQICTPGFTAKTNCTDCLCVADGSRWLCTLKGCRKSPDGYSFSDNRVTFSDRAKRSIRSTRGRECEKEGDKRETDCFTCFCDSKGFYSTCYSERRCDPYNFDD